VIPFRFELQVAAAHLRPPSFASLRAACAAALANEHMEGAVTVRIVDRAEMAELNGAFRDRAGPTNVLAFVASSDGLPAELLAEPRHRGDVVVCDPVVREEAARQHKTVAQHYVHLIVHGTLHLAGHDHQEPAEAERMEARERTILARLGLPDPYAERDA
jgi:probable rRNA maturation factor